MNTSSEDEDWAAAEGDEAAEGDDGGVLSDGFEAVSDAEAEAESDPEVRVELVVSYSALLRVPIAGQCVEG